MSHSVAIIGSGLGGLTSGIFLAQKGIDVTIYERQAVIGGYSVQFSRKGFIFDPALHAVPAGSEGQYFYKLIEEMGLGSEVSFIKFQDGPRVRFGKMSFSLPNEPDTLYEYLKKCFPSEKKNLTRFRAYINFYSKIYSHVIMEKATLLQSLPPFILHLPVFLYQGSESAEHFLKSFFQDPVLIALLYQYTIFVGIPMSDMPAVNFILMASLLINTGMYSIRGGGGGLSTALANKFKSLGGKFSTNTDICSITFNHKQPFRIIDKQKNEFTADGIIANTNLPELVSMFPDHILPGAYKNVVRKLKSSISVAQLHIGLDCPVHELGIDRHITFCFPTSNIDSCIKYQSEELFPEGFSITAPGITDPDLTSNYQNVLSIVGGVSGQRWMDLKDHDYSSAKERCKQHILDRLENIIPGISNHVVVSDLATPKTFYRYTGNPCGCLMGFNCTCGTHRNLLRAGNFPIQRIILAGAWSGKLGGFMQSMNSGKTAAEKMLKVLSRKGQ